MTQSASPRVMGTGSQVSRLGCPPLDACPPSEANDVAGAPRCGDQKGRIRAERRWVRCDGSRWLSAHTLTRRISGTPILVTSDCPRRGWGFADTKTETIFVEQLCMYPFVTTSLRSRIMLDTQNHEAVRMRGHRQHRGRALVTPASPPDRSWKPDQAVAAVEAVRCDGRDHRLGKWIEWTEKPRRLAG